MTAATAYAAAALAGECGRVAALPVGSQGEGFNVAALLVGGFVKAGELSVAEARATLLDAGLRMRNQRGREPWTRDALLAQINRAFRDARHRATPDRTGSARARPAPPPPVSEPDREDAGAADARNIPRALRLFEEAQDGRALATYFAARGLAWSGDFADIRFHPAAPRGRAERLPAMVALLRDARTGEPCGVHRTYLRPDGSGKVERGQQKMMLGRARGAAVMLTPFAEVTHGLGVAEGIETAASVLTRGWAPVWAAGSAGGVEAFPVLPGVECITVFADQGERGVEAAAGCAGRWRAAGHEARVVAPRLAGDWNDAMREAAA